MARVVVTGAAGFIGSHLAERLLIDGHEVVGVDCLLEYYPAAYKRANLERLEEETRFTLIELDLGRRDGVPATPADVFPGADVVYHLAAQAGVRASWGSSFETYTDCNVLATQRVLEACVKATVARLVYASSSSVYGDTDQLPLREDGDCRPVSPYGITKLTGEHLCTLYHRTYDLPTTIARFFTVFGPRQRPDMAFHKLLRAALQGKTFPIYGDGMQTRDFTFVGDIVEGLLTAGGLSAGRAPAPAGSVINLGGGSRVTLREAVGVMGKMLGRPVDVRYLESQAGDVRHTWADLTRARDLLGYAPRTTLFDGLRAERDWLEQVVLDRALSSAFDP